MFLPMILIGVSVLFGLSWILFAFVNPPFLLSSFYYTPTFLFFLGERTGRILIGILIGVVIPLLIMMFWL
ncbi:MAG: hypothetical protein HOW73_06525 [Polyangiaceae bacterium]|nr:hypothetical protein [Polyangiaceae bacterium]